MKKSVYYVIGGPYVSDQAGLNRGPLILIVLNCYFVSTFCEDRINTFLILILILFSDYWYFYNVSFMLEIIVVNCIVLQYYNTYNNFLLVIKSF